MDRDADSGTGGPDGGTGGPDGGTDGSVGGTGDADAAAPGTVREVFGAFLRLGLTSFGGPVAHLGFFREAFVQRRRWLSDRAYADLVALCQFLPGPASSQVCMALGLQRAGWAGMLAAWAAFTLPSAVLLVGFAYGAAALDGAGTGWLDGFKAAAAAVVAQAVLGMARTLTPDLRRGGIAAAVVVVVLLVPHPLAQVGAMAGAGLLGLLLLKSVGPPAAPDTAEVSEPGPAVRVPRAVSVAALALFAALLVVLPVLAALTGSAVLGLAEGFYRAGALVFGGGHVVLPLLEAGLVPAGLVSADAFLAGYGAAQAVPGPLFTFAAYLGAVAQVPPGGVVGAALALAAVFLPSMLLVLGVLPFWDRLRRRPRLRRALAGVNAGVVGLLAAALYDPVITTGITTPALAGLAAVAFAALTVGRVPPWAVVIGAGAAGWLLF